MVQLPPRVACGSGWVTGYDVLRSFGSVAIWYAFANAMKGKNTRGGQRLHEEWHN